MLTLDLAKLQKRVARARLPIHAGCLYGLGKGGFNPANKMPWDYVRGEKRCDCSGFVAWALGMRRDQINAKKWWSKLLPWIETTIVYRDATGPQKVFVEIPGPVPGCLVVYGDRGGSEGHIALVSAFANGHLTIIDCASGPSRRTGEAINERDGTSLFYTNPRAIYCVLREDVL